MHLFNTFQIHHKYLFSSEYIHRVQLISMSAKSFQPHPICSSISIIISIIISINIALPKAFLFMQDIYIRISRSIYRSSPTLPIMHPTAFNFLPSLTISPTSFFTTPFPLALAKNIYYLFNPIKLAMLQNRPRITSERHPLAALVLLVDRVLSVTWLSQNAGDGMGAKAQDCTCSASYASSKASCALRNGDVSGNEWHLHVECITNLGHSTQGLKAQRERGLVFHNPHNPHNPQTHMGNRAQNPTACLP